jgi:hypothetical protein
MEALLRRRSALENGITTVLLVEITPPLPKKSISYDVKTGQVCYLK